MRFDILRQNRNIDKIVENVAYDSTHRPSFFCFYFFTSGRVFQLFFVKNQEKHSVKSKGKMSRAERRKEEKRGGEASRRTATQDIPYRLVKDG